MSTDIEALLATAEAGVEKHRDSITATAALLAIRSLVAELERVKAERERDVPTIHREQVARREAEASLDKALAGLRRAKHELDQWVFADGTALYRVDRAEKILNAAIAEIERQA